MSLRSWLVLCGLVALLGAGSLYARDIFAIGMKEPALTPHDIAQFLEKSGLPHGSLVDQSPRQTDGYHWRRISFQFPGKNSAKVHLYRMTRPPYLQHPGPQLQTILDTARFAFGFVGPQPDTGPTIRLKGLIAGLLAERSGGVVYDSQLSRALSVADWRAALAREDLDYPLSVARAVLRAGGVPATPAETVAFDFIPTSFGSVAFDDRNVVKIVTLSEIPRASIEAGEYTTAGYHFRMLDVEKQWGNGQPTRFNRFVLLAYERGGLMIPAAEVHGPIQVEQLGIEIAPRAGAGGLSEIAIESNETLPAGTPRKFTWLLWSAKEPNADPLETARSHLRGGSLPRRENAIRAICRIPGPAAVGTLKEIVRSGIGEKARQIALKGLAERPDGPDALLELAANGRGHDSTEAVQTIAALGTPDALRMLVQLALANQVSTEARREALWKMRGKISAAEVPTLTSMLTCETTELRLLAADLILRVGPSAVARQVLLTEVRDVGTTNFELLVPMLMRHHITESLPMLLAAMDRVQQPMRRRIVTAIAAIAGRPQGAGSSSDVTSEEIAAWLKSTGVQKTDPSVDGGTAVPAGYRAELATVFKDPVIVGTNAIIGSSPIQVLDFLTKKGFPVGLAEATAKPKASPVEWARLKIKLPPEKSPFLSVTQLASERASGPRIIYEVNCLTPGDPRAAQASAWLAWFIAWKAQGIIVDVAGHRYDPDSWVRSVLP